MQHWTIRRLNRSDVRVFRDLVCLFGDVFEEPETYQWNQPSDAYLTDLLGQTTVIVLAAFNRSEISGGLVAYELRKFERERSEIYIYDLAVRKQERRKGIATALIAETKQIAKRCGAHVLFVQADHGDDPAIALYTKLGAREDVLHFDISTA